jgi:hypothetical protein
MLRKDAMNDQEQIQPFEFEPERFFDTFIGVAKELLVRPREFFRQLPKEGSVKNPLSFLTVCAFLTALFVANARSGDVQLFILLCCANIFSTVLGSMVMHILAQRMYRSQAPFGSTLRVLAYASLMDTVSWIPLLGPLAYFYGLYLIFLGIQEQHQITPRQAALTVAIIVCIVTALAMAIMLASPGSFSQALQMLDPQQAENSL